MTSEPNRDRRQNGVDALESLLVSDTENDGGDAPTFEAPWQARAFAVAVALYDGTDWADFNDRFVGSLRSAEAAEMNRDVEGVYYDRWLAALEELLVESGTITANELDRRQEEFRDGERDESEFVLEGVLPPSDDR